MTIGQRSLMDTQSFKGILRPLSHKDFVYPIVSVPKILKIGQKLTEIWPKNGFYKNTYVCSFSSNLVVKKIKIFLKLSPWGM